MAAISAAERLPDVDYTKSHRSPPPVPYSPAYHHQTNHYASSRSPPLRVNEGTASESASVHSEGRRGSSGSLLRRSSSNKSNKSARAHDYQNSDGSSIPPVPSVPATRIAQAQQEATNRQRANSGGRKVSGEGRTMLRKSSRMRKEEQARLEQERVERQRAPPPRLPSHHPLPGIDSFGGENTGHTTTISANGQSQATNFSRPGQPFANMPPSSYNNSSSSPAYAIRAAQSASPESRGRTNGEYVSNSVGRTESMTNRSRYSYASSTVPVNVSSPRRVRRRKDPTPFNVLVIGAKNSGKTSFISFLRHSLALPSNRQPSSEPGSTVNASKSAFTSHYLETEMDGERIGVTLWDSAGLEKNIVDLQLRETTAFVESKFEETFVEEQKVMRSPGVKDTHIHCVFLVLDPVRLDATIAAKENGNLAKVSGLDDDLDLQVMRVLWGKTTVIPVVTKADTLTMGHMSFLKRAVWESVKGAKLDPLEALELEDDIEEEDEEDEESTSDSYGDIDEFVDASEGESERPAPKSKKNHNRQASIGVSVNPSDDEVPYIPMSILSPDPYELPPYVPKAKVSKQVGRRFPWGFADPYNSEHCDFTRLRDSIFSEWRGELRDLSKTKWYENWRTSRLNNVPGSKQRLKGGVTPVAAVPREGRSFSGNKYGGAASPGVGAVPRSVSASNEQGQAVPSKAERMLGMSQRTPGGML